MNESLLEQTVAALLSGGVAIYPTETFYGLGAAISCEAALQRIASLKRRAPLKPFPVIAADAAQARALWAGPIPSAAEAMIAAFWPGPLTLVMPAREGLSATLTSPLGIGVRVSSCPEARALAAKLGPIAATSANLSGAGEHVRVVDIEAELKASVDVVWDAGTTPGGAPSTTVAFEGGVPRILREGAIPRAALEPFPR